MSFVAEMCPRLRTLRHGTSCALLRSMGIQSRSLPQRGITRARALGVLALFVSLQFADAWLTLAGIDRFGVAAEANPILASSILLFGPAASMTIAKGAAIAGGILLHQVSRHRLLALLTMMYLFVCIAPWAWALTVA
jgi:arginine exporter protein ArgO